MILTFEQEKRIIQTLLKKLNASGEEAGIVAEVLGEGDLRGFGSHGILRLPYIIRGIKRGTIVPQSKIKIVKETLATALIDGNHGLGHHVAVQAMKLAIEKAKKHGIGAVGVFNSNHFGIAGYYAEMAIKENLIGIVITTTDPLVHPWGGVEPILGTNALAVGIPAEPIPILMDMATSVASRGKILEAMKKGQKIPEGWAIDTEGYPTTDPEKAAKGALSPFGGVKGYALSFILEILAGSLVNAAVGKEVHGTLEPKSFCTKGDFMIALDPGAYTPPEEFKSRVKKFITELKTSKKAPGFTEILVPGEPEFRTREKRLKGGIPIADEVWNELKQISQELGIDLNYLKDLG